MDAAEGDATRLTIYLTEDDRVGHRWAWEALVEAAREGGLAGATVWRGVEGFGRRGYVRSSRFVDAAEGLPLAVELIDRDERIDRFLPAVARLVAGALVVRERVRVLPRRPAPSSGVP